MKKILLLALSLIAFNTAISMIENPEDYYLAAKAAIQDNFKPSPNSQLYILLNNTNAFWFKNNPEKIFYNDLDLINYFKENDTFKETTSKICSLLFQNTENWTLQQKYKAAYEAIIEIDKQQITIEYGEYDDYKRQGINEILTYALLLPEKTTFHEKSIHTNVKNQSKINQYVNRSYSSNHNFSGYELKDMLKRLKEKDDNFISQQIQLTDLIDKQDLFIAEPCLNQPLSSEEKWAYECLLKSEPLATRRFSI